jgi:kinetochor protein Mis14/NSL1
VNGLEAGSIESYMKKDEAEEFEPYDGKLHERVQSLHAELEVETLKVSQLRREAPARAIKIYEEQLKKESDGDERILVEIAKKTEVDEKAGDLGIRPLGRKGEIEEEYVRSLEILKGLQAVWTLTINRS